MSIFFAVYHNAPQGLLPADPRRTPHQVPEPGPGGQEAAGQLRGQVRAHVRCACSSRGSHGSQLGGPSCQAGRCCCQGGLLCMHDGGVSSTLWGAWPTVCLQAGSCRVKSLLLRPPKIHPCYDMPFQQCLWLLLLQVGSSIARLTLGMRKLAPGFEGLSCISSSWPALRYMHMSPLGTTASMRVQEYHEPAVLLCCDEHVLKDIGHAGCCWGQPSESPRRGPSGVGAPVWELQGHGDCMALRTIHRWEACASRDANFRAPPLAACMCGCQCGLKGQALQCFSS